MSNEQVEILLPAGELAQIVPQARTSRAFDAAAHNLSAFMSDGLYRTGDVVRVRRLDNQRYLSVEGRIKDVINRGGEKISTEEVEHLLLKHPGILGAGVVAMPDARLGERTCAYVVPVGAPLDLAEIQRHFAELGVAKFKWPERVLCLNELPKTPVGKINRKRLRAGVITAMVREETNP